MDASIPVAIDPVVYDEISKMFWWWSEHRSAEAAAQWYERIIAEIESIGFAPESYAIASEIDSANEGIRQKLFGLGSRPTHRVLFTATAEQVYVFSVRHVAQDRLKEL
ncbi:type II toxin-antitoxin system RelE/ParE family toxin [Stratiformator vulcanicus]|uniref:Plasmid stabilization system protein n=1 Tax=Stratiformator vulcanicus TaxID=2527980 RepID=A0A517QXV5_9PLAN|nr:hypothetical protein [Stratiformator vulcanicus]QDT36434.1 hypothetical protein Pan189_07900 [Stratiformator vulcanicus]